MRMIRAGFTATLAILMAAGAGAATTDAERNCASLLQQGKEALGRGLYEAAEAAFDELSAHCVAGDGHDVLFQRALAKELRAQDLGLSDQQRHALLVESRDLYEEVIAGDPTRFSAYNNVADVYLELGERASARASYTKALSLRDDDAWGRASYALFLARTGEVAGAEKVLASLHSDLWLIRRARYELIKTTRGEDTAVQFLASLVPNERSTAENVAFDVMRDRTTSPAARRRILILLSRCLAADSFLPDEFRDTALSQELRRLARASDIAEGALALARVTTDPNTSAEDLAWWRGRSDPATSAETTEAMSDLIVRIGTRLERAGDLSAAEKYFLLLMKFSPLKPDFTAVRKLAEVYALGWPDDPSKVLALAARYEKAAQQSLGANDDARRADVYTYGRAMSVLMTGFLSREIPSPSKIAVAYAILNTHGLVLDALAAGEPGTIDPTLAASVALAQRTLGRTSEAARTRLGVIRECLAVGKPQTIQAIILGFSAEELASLSDSDRREIGMASGNFSRRH
jgi:tetratricopeptide (TPR) repeat protein